MEAADSAPSVRPYGRNSPSEAVVFPPVADGVSADDAAREEVPMKFAEPSVVLSDDAVGVTMTLELVSVLLGMEGTRSMDDEELVSEIEDAMGEVENARVAEAMLESPCARICPARNKVTRYVPCTVVNFIFRDEILENTLILKVLACRRRHHSRVVANLSSFLILLPYTRFITILPHYTHLVILNWFNFS
jgi:hypothetical protein